MVLLLASGTTVASVPDNLEEFLYRDNILGRSKISFVLAFIQEALN